MRNKVTKKNMDLDLRRYGNKLYSKAEESGDGSGGNDGSGCDCDLSDYVKISDLLPTIEIDLQNPDGTDTYDGVTTTWWEGEYSGNPVIVMGAIVKWGDGANEKELLNRRVTEDMPLTTACVFLDYNNNWNIIFQLTGTYTISFSSGGGGPK